jgi:hypothetical protein
VQVANQAVDEAQMAAKRVRTMLTVDLNSEQARSFFVRVFAPGVADSNRIDVHWSAPPPRRDPETRILYVLAIGVAEYQQGVAENPPATAESAQMIKAVFERYYSRRYYADIVAEVLAAGSETTAPAIKQKVEQLLERARLQDTVVLFYSGHGMVENDEFCLLPTDGDKGLSTSNLLRDFCQRKKGNVLILDSCYSGHAVNRIEDMQVPFDAEMNGYVTWIFASSHRMTNQKGRESDFTRALISVLRGENLGPKDDTVYTDDLHRYLSRHLASQFPVSRRGTPDLPLTSK